MPSTLLDLTWFPQPQKLQSSKFVFFFLLEITLWLDRRRFVMDRHSPSPAPVLNWFCKIQYCFFRPLIVVGKLFCIENHPRLLPFQLAIATWPLSTTKLSSFSHFPPNSISILLQPHIYDFMPTYDFSSASSGSTFQRNLIAGVK